MISYILTRKQVKNTRLVIDAKGVVRVTAPPYVSEEEINQWVNSKRDWIQRSLEKNALHQQENIFPPHTIPFLGENITPDFDIQEEGLLETWYKYHAKRILVPHAMRLAAEFEIPISKVIIRDTQTKWGSFSSRKNIGLNYRLIKMSWQIIDYVIIHELCHALHFNHSISFWKEVEKRYPSYLFAEKWLKENGRFYM